MLKFSQNAETGRLQRMSRLQDLLQEPRRSTFERHEIVHIVAALGILQAEREALWAAKPKTISPLASWAHPGRVQ